MQLQNRHHSDGYSQRDFLPTGMCTERALHKYLNIIQLNYDEAASSKP